MKPFNALVDIGAALALFVLSSVIAGSAAAYLPEAFRLTVVVVVQGLLLIAVVGVLLAWRGQRWRVIGLVTPVLGDGPRALLAYGACLGVNLVFIYTLYAMFPSIVEAHTERLGFIVQQLSAGLPFPLLVVVLGFVGIYEEIFARGLLLARCRALLSGTWAPVLVSSLLFGLGHLYQGWIGVGQTTLIGIVLALVVIRWGTLWPAIIAHALLDVSSILFMEAAA
ncbi:MAG: type II CAAX endopeptidase family protein [Gammaproteobacteria bacterium]|nr:type II CAAX endopeptidase family protein [Gammaproteobacteria bacterium]